jgi:hypothetical protein
LTLIPTTATDVPGTALNFHFSSTLTRRSAPFRFLPSPIDCSPVPSARPRPAITTTRAAIATLLVILTLLGGAIFGPIASGAGTAPPLTETAVPVSIEAIVGHHTIDPDFHKALLPALGPLDH